MTSLRLDVANHRSRTVEVHWVFNAGYAGRDSAQVQRHVDELAHSVSRRPTTCRRSTR